MSDKHVASVTILDREYRINCPLEQQESLQRAAKQLDEKMRELKKATTASGKIQPTERIAVIAALNLAHQLQELEEVHKTYTDGIAQMNEKLDDCLDHDKQLEL